MVQFYHEPTVPLNQATSATDLPNQIGPYKVEKLLTTGSDTRLYLAFEEASHHLCVLKVLDANLLEDPQRKKSFLKEGQLLKGIQHPNIVQYYDQGEYADGMYIAVEFVAGISLKQFILQRSLSLKRSIDITIKVLYALLYLHSIGIVHRDLKPENILITESSEIKVVDFGIAGSSTDWNEGPDYGTPSYLPPEERRGSRQFNFTSDLFAVGVIFYELIIGRVSFGKIDLALVPKHLQKIVERATHPDLKHRYEDVMEMITDLSLYLKQGLLTEDEDTEDTLNDLLESLEQAKKELLTPAPDALIDLSVDLLVNPHASTLSYTLLQHILPDGSYLTLTASSKQTNVKMLLELKGILERAKILLETMTTRTEFSLHHFLERLERNHTLPVHLHLLHVSTIDNVFHLFSFGPATLYHHAINLQKPRELTTTGRLFGQEGELPAPIHDRLDSLDTLLISVDGSPLNFSQFVPEALNRKALTENHLGHAPAALFIQRID